MSAQVAVAADYFPAYARLPRKAQRKAVDFIRKFQHDPKQASLHYEPILNVVDKQLRSVRVGDDYRAIVRAPERGNTFLLLYIDHHDEAYRWAEGKQVQVHPSTGTLQFFDVDEASAAVTSISSSPENDLVDLEYEEKRLFSDWSDEQLFVGGVPRMLLPSVRELFTDTDLDKLLPHIPREAADLLTGLAAGYEYEEVVESILSAPATTAPPQAQTAAAAAAKAASSRPPPVITQPVPSLDSVGAPAELPPEEEPPTEIEVALTMESTQAQFRVLNDDFDLDKALAHPLDVWRVYLHPSQRKIVQAQTKGPLRITGGAGTGKTVVAMHRAAWLIRNVFTAPDDKILVTTFTKNLAGDIQHNLEKLLEPEDMTRIRVTNIDSWAFDYLRGQGQFLRLATKKHREDAWKSAFDLYGVNGFDLKFCKAEWEAVIQAQEITEQSEYVRAVRHHRGVPLPRADRRKLWELFAEYRNALQESGVCENIDVIRVARKRIEAESGDAKFRSVVVDETQDMSSEALRLIRLIAGPERANDLLLVGDAHQRIYGRPAPLSQSGINIRGRRSRELRLNYRTTASICRWSLRTLGRDDYDDLDGGTSSTRGYKSLRKGAAPTVRHFENKAEERQYVVDQVRSLLGSGILPEEICIVARTKNLLTGGYAPALDQAGIDYEILAQDAPLRSSVRLATMHRVKGLEFPVVLAVALNDGLVPLSTPELTSEDELVAALAERQERCLLYVATSRARDRLFVTSYERRSPFLDGLEVREEGGSTRPPAADTTSTVVELAGSPDSKAEPEATKPAPTEEKRAVETNAASTDAPAQPAPPTNDALLDSTPLTAWHLPTRMTGWLDRNQIDTVGQLVALDPAQLLREKNLGRKTVRDTGEVIKEKLGASWEELRSGAQVAEFLGEAGELSEEALAKLELPLAEMRLPVRFFTWADPLGLTALRDLALKHPLELSQAKNMGRTTVAAARQAVESRLGRRWEEVQRLLTSGEIAEADTGWATLAERIDPETRERPIAEVPLPKSIREYVERAKLQVVSDLIAVPEPELVETQQLTRSSVAAAARALLSFSAQIQENLRRWNQGFLPFMKEVFLELDAIPRMIVTRRAGLMQPPETLEEIGATLGVTRERVRQIEQKTWERIQRSEAWCHFVDAQCRQVAPEGAAPLEVLEENPWWKALASEPDALDYFLDRMLEGKWRVIQIEAQRYLADTAQKEVDEAILAAKRAARKLKYPLPYATAQAAIMQKASELSPAVTDIVWQEIEENLATDGDGDARRALAYGSTKYAQIVAYLEKRDEPVSINEVFAEVGRVGNFPEDVFMLARGTVGLERHFPDFQEWKKKLVPLVIQLIQDNGPERQWSCTDLIPALREEVELPDWLEHWHLAAILRRSEGIEYLGRLRVALPGVIEDSARVFVHDAAEQLLIETGQPMTWEALTEKLRAKLDVSDIALIGILNKAPFIKVAKKTYGLVTRDLPGGIEALSEALDELEGVLERRQRGLAAKFIQKEMAKLSAVHSTWTEEMCMSILRSDPRFRNAMAGNGVGLAEWDDVRIPSRLEIVQTALQKSDGRVSLEAIQERVLAIHGASIDRIKIGAIANRFGGRLDGDYVVGG